MNYNKFRHFVLGLVLAGAAFACQFFIPPDGALRRVLLWVGLCGVVWAFTIGSGLVYVLVLPIAIVLHYLVPPVRLRDGDAWSNSARVLAYSILPDRIVMVLEFSSVDGLEGRSFFLPKRIMERTEQILDASSATNVSLDMEAAERAFGNPLPALADLDRDVLDRSVIDDAHRRVGSLWQEHQDGDLRECVIHLATWYALAADHYFRRDQLSGVDHALL